MNLPLHTEAAMVSEIPDCLAGLLATLESAVRFDADRAAKLLSGLDMTIADLGPWFDLDHPLQDSYGRVLVKAGNTYELMVMSWAPGDYSAIHDHGLAEWGAVRYFGPADHVVFSEKQGLLTLQQRMTMRVDDVYAVDQSLIHLMGNPTAEPFVSLHLYGRTEAAGSITGSARIFDLYERKIQRTDGGVFFCLPEADISSREPCPQADVPTQLLHHQLMLARLERMQTAEGDAAVSIRMRALAEEIERLAAQAPEGIRS